MAAANFTGHLLYQTQHMFQKKRMAHKNVSLLDVAPARAAYPHRGLRTTDRAERVRPSRYGKINGIVRAVYRA